MNQAPTADAVPKPRILARWLTVLVLLAVAAALTRHGFDFYRLDLSDRAAHPAYRSLNPAGFVGHGYGMLGTALIATNLLYLVRKRLARRIPDSFGSVAAWLKAHVFTGLVGSLFILFHSAFQLRTGIATVTSVSLGIVVVTGLVGLYLYSLIPKTPLKRFKERVAEIEPLLPGLAKRVQEYVENAPVTHLPANAGFLRTIFTMPRWFLDARARRRGLAEAAREDKLVRAVALKDPAFVRDLVAELAELAASEVDTHAGIALMRSWRSLHRFLAILMLLSVSVHIAVAWYYGFRWIFS